MDYADILFCAIGDNLTIRPCVFNERDLRLDPTRCLQCGEECDETRAALGARLALRIDVRPGRV